ncbi:unnamed protein product [Cunninghamella echinulata]
MVRRDYYTKQSFSINGDEFQSSTIRIIMNINNIHDVISDYTVPNNLRQGGMEQDFCYLAMVQMSYNQIFFTIFES